MKWIPNPPHPLIQAPHHPPPLHPPHLLPIRIAQQFRFLENLLLLQISYAYHLFAPVDVLAADYGVAVWTGGDVDLDLGVSATEGGEDRGAKELAGGGAVSTDGLKGEEDQYEW